MIKDFKYLFIGILILIYSACKSPSVPTDPLPENLSETPLEGMGFTISIPENYKIDQHQGEDFIVFYITPKDTGSMNSYSGGVYFGNFPSEFGFSHDSCQSQKIQADLLGRRVDWKLYSCTDSYLFETVIENQPNHGCDEKIHAFGKCKYEWDIKKILFIFSTLKQSNLL